MEQILIILHLTRSQSPVSRSQNVSLSPSLVRRRSPSPMRRQNQRAPSTPHHQSSSPVRRKITNPGQQKSSSPIKSPRDGYGVTQRNAPDRQMPRKETAERPTESRKAISFSRNLHPPPPLLKGQRVPALSPSPYNFSPSFVSPPAARRTPSKERSPIPLEMQTRSGSFNSALRKLIIKKHKRWKRKDVSSDDDDIHDSHIEDRLEAKRRHKEEKKLKKEEKRKWWKERRHKKDSLRTAKLKLKAGRDVSPSSDLDKSHDSREEALFDPKKPEIELLEQALESLRAKKGVGPERNIKGLLRYCLECIMLTAW
nr:hypothetical protein [Tanacetum cinerariifolium]